VLDAVAAQLAAAPGRQLKLVANLPYNVATPVISNLLASEIVPASMTVTIQKELAERIIAPPSTKDYSALSIWMQAQCQAEIVRLMPPTVFWPRPKVWSAIVHLTVDDSLRRRIPDVAYFHDFVRGLFCHRRKYLRSVLVSTTKDQLEKSDVDRIIAELGLEENCRAEQLDVPALLALTEAVRTACAAAARP
jgi:16S rRNA (adenine1518-N6/adenine1519-N6)-dimethyltransferase